MMPVAARNREGSTPADLRLQDDDRWLLAKRIAESKTFAKSERLSRLLLYLCEQCLLGDARNLSEQNIACMVFGRRGTFDPAADTIVRSHMLRLRQKLDTYFEEEEAEERLRVTIPRGGYVPAFEDIQPIARSAEVEPSAAPGTIPETDTDSISQLQRSRKRLLGICVLLSVLCVLLLALFVVKRITLTGRGAAESSVRQKLWKELFSPASMTVLVAADSGLVMLHGATGQNTTLSEYLYRDFSKELNVIPPMRRDEIIFTAGRRYTSFVDLELFDRLTHLSEALSRNYSIRYARDINVNDLKTSNVILSGSQDADPWIELFEPQMDFRLHDDLANGVRAFANRNPQAGEQNLYVCGQFEYGVLAFLPNLSNTGNVLIVEGTSVAGTQAISDFLFTDSNLDPFLTKIARKDGSIPHFEILLASRSVSGSASRSQIMAFRRH
jgi:hypothetical protein